VCICRLTYERINPAVISSIKGGKGKGKGKGTNEYNTFINKLITIEAKHNGYDITASAEQELTDVIRRV
jgi:hypothetical protein